MKLLIIGDFHGRLSSNLASKIKKISPDIILSPGDFCGSKKLSQFFFDKIYGKKEEETSLVDILIYKALGLISLEAGRYLIRKIKSFGFPIFAIRGNWDPTPWGHDLTSKLNREDREEIKAFEKLENKKFSFVDMSFKEFDSFVLVGGASSSSSQRIKKKMVERLMNEENLSLEEAKENVVLLKRNWDKRQELYDKNFKRALEIRKKSGKKIIFLTHNCPYKTKLDRVKKGIARGKHCGSYQEKLVVQRYKPDFVFCGHIHEGFGVDRIGKSRIYNVGSALNSKFVVLDI